jgi:hypothetical protein
LQANVRVRRRQRVSLGFMPLIVMPLLLLLLLLLLLPLVAPVEAEAEAQTYSATFRLLVEGSIVPNGEYQTLVVVVVPGGNSSSNDSGGGGGSSVQANTQAFLDGLNAAMAGEHLLFLDSSSSLVAVLGLTLQACGIANNNNDNDDEDNSSSSSSSSYIDRQGGVCRVCTHCDPSMGRYEAEPCGPTIDAVCVSACSAGTYAQQGTGVCSECTLGHFSDLAGQTACSACSAGAFAAATGATRCNACGHGTTSLSGSTMCFDAVRGRAVVVVVCAEAAPAEMGCSIYGQTNGARVVLLGSESIIIISIIALLPV